MKNRPKIENYGGFKLRGLGRNQISIRHLIYLIDHRIKINALSDFENETPTHISATNAISKIGQKSQNRNSLGIGPKVWYP